MPTKIANAGQRDMVCWSPEANSMQPCQMFWVQQGTLSLMPYQSGPGENPNSSYTGDEAGWQRQQLEQQQAQLQLQFFQQIPQQQQMQILQQQMQQQIPQQMRQQQLPQPMPQQVPPQQAAAQQEAAQQVAAQQVPQSRVFLQPSDLGHHSQLQQVHLQQQAQLQHQQQAQLQQVQMQQALQLQMQQQQQQHQQNQPQQQQQQHQQNQQREQQQQPQSGHMEQSEQQDQEQNPQTLHLLQHLSRLQHPQDKPPMKTQNKDAQPEQQQQQSASSMSQTQQTPPGPQQERRNSKQNLRSLLRSPIPAHSRALELTPDPGPPAGPAPVGAVGKQQAPAKQRRRRKDNAASKESTGDRDREFLQQLGQIMDTGDVQAKTNAIAHLKGKVVEKSLESELSSRTVQMALKAARKDESCKLSEELKGHVVEAAQSLHGNHVLQRAIELLPADRTSWVAAELLQTNKGPEVARNVFGCRIFCRLMEHSAENESTKMLMAKVLEDTHDLVRNQFGRFVAQAILEQGNPDQRSQLALLLSQSAFELAQNRNASHVVEKALLYCDPADKQRLAVELLREDQTAADSGVAALAKNQFGGFVVKALVDQGGNIEAEARRQLAELVQRYHEGRLGKTKEEKYAEKLLKELQLLEEDELPIAVPQTAGSRRQRTVG
mmetsp:Transcript_63529/g.113030  ORF Transcript_63529/g.113030 Transcript_63529/m.113030 type:complete len:661 (-) Transcript_63529:153-2135(-)